MHALTGRTVLLTGGDSGIGRATVLELARRGAHVLLTSPTHERAQQAVHELRRLAGVDVRALVLELGSFRSVHAVADDLLATLPRLDVLVHNAGVLRSQRGVTAEGFEHHLGINHLGPLLLTLRLWPLLRRSAPARVIVTTSLAHRMVARIPEARVRGPGAALESGVRRYARSKLANLWFAQELARRGAAHGVAAFAIHPGVVATELAQRGPRSTAGPSVLGRLMRWSSPLLRTPAQAAEGVVRLASAALDELVPGALYFDGRVERPSRAGRDAQAAAALWERSLAWIAAAERGVNPPLPALDGWLAAANAMVAAAGGPLTAPRPADRPSPPRP